MSEPHDAPDAAPFAGPAGPTPTDAALATGWAMMLAALSLFGRGSAPESPPLVSGILSGIFVTATFAMSLAWLRALRARAPLRDVLRLPLRPCTFVRHTLFGALAGLACVLPTMGLAWGSRWLCARLAIPDPPQSALSFFFDPRVGPSARAAAVLAVVAAAPLTEELLYRALIFQGAARALPPALALPATSALFSAAHLSVPLFVPLLGVGLVFGAVFRSLGLAASFAAHAAFNAGNLLVGVLLFGTFP